MSSSNNDELSMLLSTSANEEENGAALASFIDGQSTRDPKQLGKLQSQIKAKIHTHQVAKLIQGHKIQNSNSKNYSAIGLYNFSTRASVLESAIKKDDPYADCIFYHIHEEINVARADLSEKVKYFKNWINNSIPKSLDVSDSINLQPLEMEFKFNSTLAFHVMYIVLDLDEYIRLIKLAQHIALVESAQASNMIQDQLRNIRRIMNMIIQFKHTDVTRDDIAANNKKAQRAAEAMKIIELDEGFLNATKRSKFAPFIANRPEKEEESEKNAA